MRIILSVESLGQQLSGIGRYTAELMRRLPNYLPGDALRFHHQQRWLRDPERLLQQPLPEVFTSQRLPLAVRNIRRFCLRSQWRKRCQGHIFHGPNYFLPPYADHGVITIHDLSVLRFPAYHPAERVRQHRIMLARSMRASRALIAVSEFTKREIIEVLDGAAERIHVTPLAANGDYHPRTALETRAVLAQYGLQHGAYTLSVATLEPRKNIGNLIAAYADLPSALKARYPLVLVGADGWCSAAIHAQIKRYACAGWLKYLGFIKPAHLPMLYAGARTSAYTSIYEGFGLPILEAMASGVPVVASNAASLLEVSKGVALHVVPDDVDTLCAALQQSLEDKAWRQQIIPLAIAVSAGYSWDNCIKQTIAVYQKLR
jgi:glycosyltransferase involved in cell wall biosynthesis